ncbi:cytochrome P450 [Gonapodya prolifera JEL478]|uniref:Cytochrome P450 n=1 Tax=Gonapodya prolifera (strain JEL478) TaxID=1344416 RepID=A0A139AZY1_GONPJ|nr:cytochrome P450 [Gonapodya prolifera JEL478]|eukprot:KXS22250.1 cytochrome P450 [Gonapodya prolifera JEL478]
MEALPSLSLLLPALGLLFASAWLLSTPQRAPNQPPYIPLTRLLWLLLTDHRSLWVKLGKEYAPVAQLKIPFFTTVYFLFGPDTSQFYHREKSLNFLKGIGRITGPFSPDPECVYNSTRDIGEAVNRMLVDPKLTAHMVDEVKKVETRWKGGVTDDLFGEIFSLVMKINLRCVYSIDSKTPDGAKILSLVPQVDPERIAMSGRAYYNRSAVIKECAEVFEELKSLFSRLYYERAASSTPQTTDGLVIMGNKFRQPDGQVDDFKLLHLAWSFLFAAQVNTFANMSWVLTRIAHDPVLAKRVYDEQVAIFSKRATPVTSSASLRDAIPTVQELGEMQFLDRVLVENIRVSSPGVSLRWVDSDLEWGPYTIPKNHMLGFPHPSMHWDERLFADPLKFDPDRVVPYAGLDGKDSAGAGVGEGGLHGNYNFAVWGLGRHPCVGARFAIAEMKTVISHLVRTYEMHLQDGQLPAVPFQMSTLYKPKSKVGVRFVERRD